MGNICSSTSVRNLDIKDLQTEFNFIRKTICTLQGKVSTITGNTTISSSSGNILVDSGGLYVPNDKVRRVGTLADLYNLSPTGVDAVIVDNIGTYKYLALTSNDNGYSNITASTGNTWVLGNAAISSPKRAKETVELSRVLPGVVTNTLENFTKNGALSTATITAPAGYDKFAVTGGDATSYIVFDRITAQDNLTTLKAKIRCDVVGASDPIVGIGFKGVKLNNDTSSVYYSQGLCHLLTKACSHVQFTASVNTTPNLAKSSAGTLAANGDILEISLEYDDANTRFYFRVMNTANGEFSEAYWNLTARNISFDNRPLVLILGDGTYTLLEYKAFASVPKEPLLGIVGDSYACGDNINLNLNWPYLVKQALPQYDVVCFAGNGAYQNSMATYQLREVMKLKPKYVLFFQILNVFWGYFDDGNANQTEFDTANNRMMDAITGYGGIPILVKWQTTGGFINGNSAAWDTKRASIIASYPTTLTLDLSGQSLQLNNSSHLTTSDTVKVTKQIVELLKTAGAV